MSQTQNQKNQSQKEASSKPQAIINKCQFIVDGLKDNGAWQVVVEDFEKQRKDLDDTWHFITNEKHWYEARVTKLAVNKILNLVGDYENDMKVAQVELSKIKDTETNIPADVDN